MPLSTYLWSACCVQFVTLPKSKLIQSAILHWKILTNTHNSSPDITFIYHHQKQANILYINVIYISLIHYEYFTSFIFC